MEEGREKRQERAFAEVSMLIIAADRVLGLLGGRTIA